MFTFSRTRDEEQPHRTARSLVEGAAEFVGEMISGRLGNPGIFAPVVGHETEIETAFVPDDDKTGLSCVVSAKHDV